MNNLIRSHFVAIGTAMISFAVAPLSPALAQSAPAKQQAPAKQAPGNAAPAQKQVAPAPQPPPFRETALTDKQIESVLDSQTELDAIAAKAPQAQSLQPDPKLTAQLEEVVKKHGFASYDEYNGVVETISVVLGGIDPKTKTYVGPEAMLKQQIAAVKADKKMSAGDKKAALDEMNAMLKSPPPTIQNKANIDLVQKYYDRLAAAMQEGQ